MPPDPQPTRRRAELAIALAAGVVATVLAYSPYRVPGLGIVMLAPIAFLLDAATPRRAFALAWLYSVVFGAWLVRWVVHALAEYEVAALPAWIFTSIVVFGLALVPATAGAAYAALRPRLRSAAAPLAFAALWTLGEWVRGALLGMPWLLAAQTVTRWPIAIQGADFGGQYAVSFVLLAIGGGIGIAARRRSGLALVAPFAIAALWLAYGAARLATGTPGDAPRLRVGIVQASVPQGERFQDPSSAARNLARHETATRELAARDPLDLVIWSETAVDTDLDLTPAIRARLERLAAEIGVPIVTGAPRTRDGRHFNAVVLVAPDGGVAESYDKQRLVPFSEYDPALGGLLTPLIGPVVAGAPYAAGTKATVFRAVAIPFATPICFEITDPALVRRFRAAGAQLLVNLSNDAWFGRIGYPEMHFDHAIFRAVETRMPVLRGANTGISGVVDAAGRVGAEIPAFEAGTLRVEVAAAGPPPLYARTGDAPLVVALLLVIAITARSAPKGAAPGSRRRRSGRRRPAAAPPAAPAATSTR